MKALVVFESMFGNTQMVAKALAQGLSASMSVDVVEVGTAPAVLPDDVRLLVVGGPTHAFGLSRPTTRQDAAAQAEGPLVSPTTGLQEWLAALPTGSATVAAAAFDTRVDKPRVPGSAARGAQRRLARLGFHVAAPAESFFVSGVPGPLVDGEVERALRWGGHLAVVVAAAQPV